MKKHHHILIFLGLCIGGGIGIAYTINHVLSAGNRTTLPSSSTNIIEKATSTFKGITTQKTDTSAHLIFVGDLMVDRGVEQSVQKNMGGDFKNLFEHLSFFKDADAVFLNLEGPVTIGGTDVGSRFSFAMNPLILPVLKEFNVQIVSFANNHVGDRSTAGFKDTLDRLDAHQILYTGAGRNRIQATTPTIFTSQGITFGFIGCSDVGPAWLAVKNDVPGELLCSDPELTSIIQQAKKNVDILIFSAHWGTEYHPATERQKKLAHAAIDAGADMVIGHHPHVVQTTEWYQGKFIAYSLGNFIFDQYFSDETMQGLLVDATFTSTGVSGVTLKTIELNKTGKKYQPFEVRETRETDFLTKGSVTAQTCPAEKEAARDLSLVPIGPDRDIGNYIPKNLIPLNNHITVQTSASCLTENAALALVRMVRAMEKENLALVMTSGFRSRNTQEDIHKNSATTQEALLDPSKHPSVALPGHSEHQLGVAADFKSGNDPEQSYDNFKNSAEYAWLIKHAASYGFVQSYALGKESLTGYIGEPWHWRYVGTTHAQAIRDQGITPFEYLQQLEKDTR